jgi:hypothetical protein
MYGQKPFTGDLITPILKKGNAMKAHLKSFTITVGVVLVGFYLMRQVKFTSDILDKVLIG